MLKHKGYIGHVEFDSDAEIFHGEVVNTRDVITFQGTNTDKLKAAFIDSVEDYLAFCKERGEKPDKPFSGHFMVRTTPENHKAAFIAAKTSGVSLNAWLNDTIEKAATNEHT